MMKRLLKFTLIGVALLVVAAVVLIQFFGLRVELDGGARPHLRFVQSADDQARAIAMHREAQRVGTPEPVEPAPAAPTATGEEEDEPEPAEAEPAPTGPVPYWTDFRGPTRDGHYTEQPILTSWPAGGLTPMWRQPAGAGYASFVIANERAFTIEQRGREEVVAAYDVDTGRELWTHTWTAEFREILGGVGPRATPVWSDGLVYALGAVGELRCLDETTGQMVWRVNILEDNDAANLQWGMAASPLVVDDTILVLPGGPGGRSVVAYDRQTGERAWSALDDKQAYSSPMLVTLGGVRQLLVLSATRLVGLRPVTGEVLWEHGWVTQADINVAQPIVVAENRVFVSSGYGVGAAVFELTPDGDGFAVAEVWRNIRMKNRFASSVLHDGYLYGLDESIMACVDVETGDLQWKAGRYGYGQVVLADGHLIVLTEDGDLALVRATPEGHDEVARFPVLDGKTWNYPALSKGRLLVRNLQEMAAFDLRLPDGQ
jgi:outer membrane protein assembly factor BamB